ncbi:hypothetical protein A3Q37_03016 [Streptomyces sp. PTY087I2]|nr:hypothetical protein A3Q37_03016 [Streptomyces sp. PTY087I2]
MTIRIDALLCKAFMGEPPHPSKLRFTTAEGSDNHTPDFRGTEIRDRFATEAGQALADHA